MLQHQHNSSFFTYFGIKKKRGLDFWHLIKQISLLQILETNPPEISGIVRNTNFQYIETNTPDDYSM